MKNRSNKPNILLIMADQLAPQFLPCYGHGVVKAPEIRKLADEGVVFDAAYTNFPLCAPSRFVMMSGRLPSQIAAWDNAVEFSSEIPTSTNAPTAASNIAPRSRARSLGVDAQGFPGLTADLLILIGLCRLSS